MTQFWGPAVDAEVEYRRTKLAKAATNGRRRRRRVRRLATGAANAAQVTRAQPAA